MKRVCVLGILASLVGACQAPKSSIPERVVLPPRATSALIFTSNAYNGTPGSAREVFALDADGSGLTRLSVSNSDTQFCDNVEAVPAPDGQRFAVRRILDPAEGERLFILDSGRGVEGELTPGTADPTSPTGGVQTGRFSGLDWSPLDDILVYSGVTTSTVEDLYRTIPRPDPGLGYSGALTFTPTIRERRPRIDPTGSVAAFERIEAELPAQIYIFVTGTNLVQVTTGGTPGPVLPGTVFRVGSDTDPAYSPDAQSLVFRRLTGIGSGRGTWDLMVVRTDGSGLAPLVAGPIYRGAPDWGPQGILFVEVDAAEARLVLVDADGRNPRKLYSTSPLLEISHPRWMR